VLSLLEDKKNAVDPSAVMQRLGVSRGYAKKLLHELTNKGWLHRHARARYRIVPPEWGPHRLPNLDVHAVALAHAPDGYVGLASAANLHGLTTQHRRVIFVLLACFSGVGLILYVVLWVAAPEEPLLLPTAVTYPPPADPQV